MKDAVGSSLRGWIAGVAASALAIGCTSTPAASPAPPPDPRIELARHHDEFWAYLGTTYDHNRDGRIDRTEYTRAGEGFAHLDRDGDGCVTRSDFDHDVAIPPDLGIPMLLVRSLGDPRAESIELVRAFLNLMHLDATGDGRISRAEFMRSGGGSPLGTDSFDTLLAGMDADHDELLSAPEILQWLVGRDTDQDGRLVLRERDRGRVGPPPREGYLEPELRDAAPDFTAISFETGAPVALSSLLGKRPVALIFGSFT